MPGAGDWSKRGRGGGRDGCRDGLEEGFNQFGGIDGGGYIGTSAGQGMDVGDGGGDDRGSAVMGGGRDACVGNGGVNEEDCCRFSGVV